MPEARVEGLHPNILFAVNEETLRSALNAHLVQPDLRMTVETLRHRVEDGVVHTLLQPQLPVVGFVHLIDVVASHRCGIFGIRVVGLDAVAVVAVQAIRRTYPHESVGVAPDTQHL